MTVSLFLIKKILIIWQELCDSCIFHFCQHLKKKKCISFLFSYFSKDGLYIFSFDEKNYILEMKFIFILMPVSVFEFKKFFYLYG